MSFVTTQDGVDIYYKDWGPRDAQPIHFHHGWPLSADDWDNQMLFFLGEGYRVIAHDRRGHGRSSQVWNGHDMDHYASDVNAVVEHLDVPEALPGVGEHPVGDRLPGQAGAGRAEGDRQPVAAAPAQQLADRARTAQRY